MKLKFAVILLSFAVVLSCKRADKDNVVLKVGKYTLAKSEVKAKRENNRYKSLTNQEFEDKLIEEGRIIAFTLDHRYDTISTLNTLLHYASRAYVSREDGFVWNKKVKPGLQLTEKAIRDAYDKRSQEYTFEIIRLSEKSNAEKYFKVINNFDLLHKNALSDKTAMVFTLNVRFPYYPLCKYINISDTLKAGDVLKPGETEDGYICSRVQSVKPFLQKSYEDEKPGIKNELRLGLAQKYVWDNQKQLLDKAKPAIHDRALLELVSKFDASQKSWPGINPTLKLMEYTFSGKRVAYLVSDFKEFVDNEPVFMGSLANPLDVRKMLQSVIITQYLSAEAQQMNVEADGDYIQFRKNYQENIFIGHFRRNYIFPKISTPSENELEDYYRNHRDDFKAFESAKIAVYKFKDNNSAVHGQMMLSRKSMGNLPKASLIDLKIKDLTYDPKLIVTILKLNQSQVSSPLEVNGEFLIIVLVSKEGLTNLPFNYAKNYIRQIVSALKEKELSSRLQDELEDKYPTEKNTIKVYLSQLKGQGR